MLKIEVKTINGLTQDYLLYSNYYYLNIGNKKNLLSLYNVLHDFICGRFKNSSPLFKVNFNDKFLYIRNMTTNKVLGVNKSEVSALVQLIEAELTK